MLSRSYSAALAGMDGHLVSIECDMTNGLPGFVIVGLADKAVEEARERVRSAIKHTGLALPPRRITINLAPADLPKDGSAYDLAIALAVLAASDQIDGSLLEDSLFLGELALDGSIRPVKGSIIGAQLAKEKSLTRLFVPTQNANEANLLGDMKVFAVDSLLEVYRHLIGNQLLSPVRDEPLTTKNSQIPVDLSNVYGQTQAKRAVEIAAAGGHNILLSGPPGTGKTMLAKAMMGLLPQPSIEELIQITKLHSIAGNPKTDIVRQRPFRSPHHTASHVALIGGGTIPRPGEISLSHGGVLFLDELPEFPRGVLEVLRQPLEEGSITVARAAGVVTFPARFMLVGTCNLCPCGYAGDGTDRCSCKAGAIASYQKKLSGPLLDRIDLIVNVPRMDTSAIIRAKPAEPTKQAAQRVQGARAVQSQRLKDSSAECNAQMDNQDLRKYCKLNNETSDMAKQAMLAYSLSARGYSRTLKVARTIADLEGARSIELPHFMEALQYRPAEASSFTPQHKDHQTRIKLYTKSPAAV